MCANKLQSTAKPMSRLLWLVFLSLILLLVLMQLVFGFKSFPGDAWISLLLREHSLPFPVYRFFDGVTCLANTETVIVLLLLMGLGSLIGKRYRLEVALLTLEAGLAAVVESFIKHQYSRIRPIEALKGLHLTTYSFPSGHAVLSVCFYGLLFYFLAQRYPSCKPLIVTLAVLSALLIGSSRILLQAHYPSDVLGGYLVAVPLLALGIWLYQRVIVRV